MMYEQCLNYLGLREDPFHISPDPHFYYSTPSHESALAELLFGIETRQGLMVLTGEAGTGKTILLNQVLDWLHRSKRSSAYIFHTHLQPIGLLRFILRDFGVPCLSRSKSDLVGALHSWLLERHTAGDRPVLILDEAQALPLQTLDELRLLLNLETPRGKLLQIVLAGQPELSEKLNLPALRQLRQRIMFYSHLRLLTKEETAASITKRLVSAGCTDLSLFPGEVVEDIYASSSGIPRVVNLLCEHALISAYAEQQRWVSLEMIRRIAMDFDLQVNPLAVSDSVPEPYHMKLETFRVMENSLPPEDVFLDVEESSVSVAVAPALQEEAIPKVQPISAPTLDELSYKPTYWRRRKRQLAVVVSARIAYAAVHSAWHAISQPIVSYVRSVSQSFAHDWRLFARSLSVPTPALEIGTSSGSTNEKSPALREVLAPIVNWLRRPIAHGRASSSRFRVRSSEDKSRSRTESGW